MEQHFQGGLGRVHRAFIAAANRVTTADSPMRRWISPAYASLLWALSGGRGVAGEINGDSYRLDPRFRWRMWPDYEAGLAAYLRARIKPGDHCADVGANIGLYVLQMARWTAPDGRITAFEPNPETFRVLERHVRMNGMSDRVTLVRAAAGGAAGSAELFDTNAGSGLSRLGGANPAIVTEAASSRVEVVRLDEYFSGGRRPDWILIDVEGYEFDVLRGAREIIRAGARVVVEIHPHLWPQGAATEAEARRLVAALGRRLVPVEGQGDPWTHYGSARLEPLTEQESV